MSEETVDCPECGTTFELWETGGYCPDTDCGVKHPQARQQPNDAVSQDEAVIEDGSDAEAESQSEENEDTSGWLAERSSADDEEGIDDTNPEARSGGEAENEGGTASPEAGSVDEADAENHRIDCPSCGESISPDAAFCQYCGTEVEIAATPEPEGSTSCPSCGVDVDADQSFCSECGTDLQTDIDTAHTGRTTEHESGSAQISAHQEIELDIEGERIDVDDGDLVGREIRQAFVDTGGSRDTALLIHREHIEFDVRDDGVYLIDHGQNATRITGTALSAGDEQQLEDGDTIELSDVIEVTVHIS